MVQSKLTRRELEVLALVARGDANKVIARALSISLGTVKAHVKAVCEKLGATSRTHGVAMARERGLLGDAREVASLR
jgi:two-component system NarL family response regulator